MAGTSSDIPNSNVQHIRVLHIITDLSPAGTETKLLRLIRATDRNRFTPAVLTLRDRGELKAGIEDLGVEVFSLNLKRSWAGPLSTYRLMKVVRQFDPDLIHGWMYHGNIASQVGATFARRKVAVLWSIHQSLYSFALEKRLTALIIRLGALSSGWPNGIVYVSDTSVRQHQAIGYNNKNASVFFSGFDTEVFAPSSEARHSLRSELKLAPDSLLIGLIGRYHPAKDHANFLTAAALLVKQHSHVHFVLCGKRVDPHNRILIKLVQELQLTNHVHLLGERRDIARITAALDIAASSSCTEGFPNVVGEAMSSGIPCVVTDVSDFATIVGETGRVVPPRDHNALASALTGLIDIGPAERANLGARARARIIEHYSLASSVVQYEEIYEKTINETKQKRAVPLEQQAVVP